MKYEKKCSDCKYRHKIKDWKDNKVMDKSVCTMLIETDEKSEVEYDCFAAMVDDNDICENFVRRNDA